MPCHTMSGSHCLDLESARLKGRGLCSCVSVAVRYAIRVLLCRALILPRRRAGRVEPGEEVCFPLNYRWHDCVLGLYIGLGAGFFFAQVTLKSVILPVAKLKCFDLWHVPGGPRLGYLCFTSKNLMVASPSIFCVRTR